MVCDIYVIFALYVYWTFGCPAIDTYFRDRIDLIMVLIKPWTDRFLYSYFQIEYEG